MTSSGDEPVVALDSDESWQLMSSVTLGRLITVVDNRPDVFPVNFVVQRGTILIRSAEGTKLISALINPHVVFEVDDHTAMQGWSVVVRGQAHVLLRTDEVAEADRAEVLPWTATDKHRYLRIEPTEVSGRRFLFGSEPERSFNFG